MDTHVLEQIVYNDYFIIDRTQTRLVTLVNVKALTMTNHNVSEAILKSNDKCLWKKLNNLTWHI